MEKNVGRNPPHPPIFGCRPEGVVCHPRPAAYAVITNANGQVGVVRGPSGYYWLPGGGSDPGETPEETVRREVREELGRQVRLLHQVGAAVQFFYAASEKCWYEMTAVFFRAEFEGEPLGAGEYELHWLDTARQGELFFHACHAWAASRASEE
jgi:8-oxo-dGTP diphosphatase